MFAEDDNNTIWTSGGGPVIGWFDSKKYLETGDGDAAQGWTPLILDYNGGGPPDLAKLGMVMTKHGLIPVLPGK